MGAGERELCHLVHGRHFSASMRHYLPLPGIVARLRSLRLQQGRQSSRRIGQHFPCMAGSNATASRPSSSEVVMAHWLTNGRGLASGIADGWDAVKTASLASAGTDYKHRINASNTSTAAIPRAPPEWQPPTDPSGPRAPPEFTPPRDPGSIPGTVPEFEPPEQAPPGIPRPSDPPTPGRPARPEEIPDPERDPLRTPERRRETQEPDEEPQEEPESEEQDVMAAVAAYVEDCQETFSIADERGGGVEISLGENSCPAVLLYHPTGYSAMVNMHGANVVSWKRPDGTDILHMRPDSPLDGISPILGGIPIIFPQYGRASGVAAYAGVGNGKVPTNGVLNRLHWSLLGTGVSPLHAADPSPTALFSTGSDDETYAVWPYHFEATYMVSVMDSDEVPTRHVGPAIKVRGRQEPAFKQGTPTPPPSKRGRKWKALDDKGNVQEEGKEIVQENEDELELETIPAVQLRCVLHIHNTDDKPITFEAALQSHVSMGNAEPAEALGLFGKLVLDCDSNPDKPWLRTSDEHSTTFGESRIDRVYINAGDKENGSVYIKPGDPRYQLELIHRGGFRDVGLWNPYNELSNQALSKAFMAFSSGAIARPITLQPDEHWAGVMVMRLHAQDHLVPQWD